MGIAAGAAAPSPLPAASAPAWCGLRGMMATGFARRGSAWDPQNPQGWGFAVLPRDAHRWGHGGRQMAELGGGVCDGSRVPQRRRQEGTGGQGPRGASAAAARPQEMALSAWLGGSRLEILSRKTIRKGESTAPGPRRHPDLLHPEGKPFPGSRGDPRGWVLARQEPGVL